MLAPVAGLAALLAVGRTEPVAHAVSSTVARIESSGPWAGVIFVVAYVAAVVLMVPGSVLTLAAGYISGAIQGSILVSIASTTGASLAFGIARWMGR